MCAPWGFQSLVHRDGEVGVAQEVHKLGSAYALSGASEVSLEALARDWEITLKPEETRRNVVTEGAPLNHLVGKQFRIGADVVLEGMRLNVPCQYLEDLVGIKSLFKSLINRSGLNCRIVTGGTIRGGDSIGPV